MRRARGTTAAGVPDRSGALRTRGRGPRAASEVDVGSCVSEPPGAGRSSGSCGSICTAVGRRRAAGVDCVVAFERDRLRPVPPGPGSAAGATETASGSWVAFETPERPGFERAPTGRAAPDRAGVDFVAADCASADLATSDLAAIGSAATDTPATGSAATDTPANGPAAMGSAAKGSAALDCATPDPAALDPADGDAAVPDLTAAGRLGAGWPAVERAVSDVAATDRRRPGADGPGAAGTGS